MKKIPTIFKRNPENMRELLNEPHPDCLWVFEGEGVATRKYDGTCCLIKDGKLFKRREYKEGKTVPGTFTEEDYDPVTKKTVGWVPVCENDPADKWHIDGLSMPIEYYADGTYELVGPKIQGNPEEARAHTLMLHDGAQEYNLPNRSMEDLKLWLSTMDIEGIVFHHPDGRIGKIKKRDFGLSRVIN